MRQTQRRFPKEPQDIESCGDVHGKEEVKENYRYCRTSGREGNTRDANQS